MEFITIFLVCCGFAGLVLQYWKNEAPFCLLTELLALGGLVCVLDEYSNSMLADTPALVLVVAMVGVMVWSAWNMVKSYWPVNNKRR